MLTSGARRVQRADKRKPKAGACCYTSCGIDRIGDRMSTQGRMVICQISDIHCGSPYFIPDLLERSILEINDLDPTAVVVSGDLTNAGYRQEFETAAEYVRRFR